MSLCAMSPCIPISSLPKAIAMTLLRSSHRIALALVLTRWTDSLNSDAQPKCRLMRPKPAPFRLDVKRIDSFV